MIAVCCTVVCVLFTAFITVVDFILQLFMPAAYVITFVDYVALRCVAIAFTF